MGEWLTTSEAAALLGVDHDTVTMLIGHGRLPAYRIGRVHLISPTDLSRFSASRDVQLVLETS